MAVIPSYADSEGPHNRERSTCARSFKNHRFIVLSPIDHTTVFPFRLSRFGFHPHRIVDSGATETALGKNLTYLNRYSASLMCLAVILAGGHAFIACFGCHLGSPPSLRSSRNLMVSVVFFE
jgi:hypothetical protein